MPTCHLSLRNYPTKHGSDIVKVEKRATPSMGQLIIIIKIIIVIIIIIIVIIITEYLVPQL